MREPRLCPVLGVYGHVKQHFTTIAWRQVSQRNYSELRHNGKSDDPLCVLADAEVLYPHIIVKEIGGREQTTGRKRVYASVGGRVERHTVDQVLVGVVLEVLAAMRELTPRRIGQQLLWFVTECVFGIPCLEFASVNHAQLCQQCSVETIADLSSMNPSLTL